MTEDNPSAPVTPDTLTTKDIRRWRRALIGHPDKDDAHRKMIADCNTAITDRRAMAFQMPGVREAVDKARQRVCDAINAARREAP